MRYRYPFAAALAAASALALSGCGANFSTAYRTYSLEGTAGSERPQSIVIDAKQRAILAAPVALSRTANGGTNIDRAAIVCAEPSPDALSAISASFSGSFGGIFGPSEEVQAALAGSFSEAASQLGVRNATIQLLRDGLYRQCEAHMNGLISEAYYEQIANKYANAMVTLLAIEELTPNKAKGATVKAEKGSTVSADTNVSVSTPKEEPSEDGQQEGEQTEGETTEGNQKATGKAKAESAAPTVNVNLPDEDNNVQPHVSAAVNNLVVQFLFRDLSDYCLRQMAGGIAPGTKDRSLPKEFIELCNNMIEQQIKVQQQTAVAASMAISQKGIDLDDCATSLESFWMPGGEFNDENEAKIRKAIADLGLQVGIADLINTNKFSDAKLKVGNRLKLSGCVAGG